MENLWGGMYDPNRDGMTDMAEQYIGFRIWEEMNGIREDNGDREEEDDDDDD